MLLFNDEWEMDMNHTENVRLVVDHVSNLLRERNKDIEKLIQASGGWEKWFQGELLCKLREDYTHENNYKVYTELRYPSKNEYCDIVITKLTPQNNEFSVLWIELKCMALNTGIAGNKGDWTESSIKNWCEKYVAKDATRVASLGQNVGGIALLVVPNIGKAAEAAIEYMASSSNRWEEVFNDDSFIVLGFNHAPTPNIIDLD